MGSPKNGARKMVQTSPEFVVSLYLMNFHRRIPRASTRRPSAAIRSLTFRRSFR